MSFYFRKSVSVGPLRLNFSTAGVGASVGVRGLRLGVGPSGAYVHAGVGGLYYRSSLSAGGRRRRRTQLTASSQQPSALDREIASAQPTEWREIDSGDPNLMVDSSAEVVIEQLKQRHDTTYWFPVALIGGLVLLLFLAGQASSALATANTWWKLALGVASLAVIAASVWGYRFDAARRGGVALLYDLDEPTRQAFERLYLVLERLAQASIRYHCRSDAAVASDKRRYHGGAGTLIDTTVLTVNLVAPSRISANVPIPSIPAGAELLSFFPERLLVIQCPGRSEKVGAVPYRDLQMEMRAVSFTLDTENAPPNTRLLGHTWQYVNNNGTPDRRFKNNRQLANVACERILFRSQSGLNEELLHSSPGLGDELRASVRNLAEVLTRAETTVALQGRAIEGAPV